MQSDYSELVERIYSTARGMEYVANMARAGETAQASALDQCAKNCDEAATAITTLQAELAEARQALEEAAQEADKWFPANTAAKYPALCSKRTKPEANVIAGDGRCNATWCLS